MPFVPDQPARGRFVPDAPPPQTPSATDYASQAVEQDQPAPVLTPGEAGGGIAGMPEGARRAWAGLRQTGASLQDAYDLFVWGQKGTHLADFTKQENARRAAATEAYAQGHTAEEQGGREGGAQVAETALDTAPVAAAGAALPAATGLVTNIGRGAVLGGVAGGVPFAPSGDKGSNVATGVALGGAVSAIGGTIAAARNYVANAIRSNSARSEAAYQAAAPAMGWGTPDAAAAGGDPTLAQRTGSPMARSLEGQSFNARLQEKYQKVNDWFASRFKTVFGLPDTPVPALDDAFQGARKDAQASIDGLRRQASQAYSDGMTEAQRLGQQVGYGPNPPSGPTTYTQGGVPQTGPGYATKPQMGARVQTPNFGEQYQATVAEDTGRFGNRSLPADFIRDARQALAGGNGMSVQDLAGLLRRLSAMNQDTNPELRAFAGRLRDSLNTDLDLVARDASGAHPAVQQVLQTRAAYKAAQQRIESLQDTAAFKFLGIGEREQNVDASTLVSRFSALEPGKQTQVADYMRNYAPDLFSQMRGRVLQDAATRMAGQRTPAAATENSPAALVDSLYGNGDVLKTSGLWNKEEQVNFQRFRQAVRVIDNVDKAGGNSGTNIVPAELGQNLVSRNPTFVARLIGRIATAGQGDKLFSNPDAMRLLTQINNTSGPKQTAAIAAYAAYLSRQSPPSEQGQAPQ